MITVTKQATEEFKRIVKNENIKYPVYIRAKIKGGGCAGFQYDLYIDDEDPVEIDEIFDVDEGIKIVVDQLSYQYLMGTEIMFEKSMLQEGFKFNNPNIKASCGCGNSFDI